MNIGRTVALARTMLVETQRAPGTLPGAFALFLATPLLMLLLGTDAGGIQWLARDLPAEGLRLMLPLGAIVGAAFLIRPAMARGWSVLPARRAEWFVGSALAGTVVLALCAVLIAAGAGLAAILADSTSLGRARIATSIETEGVRERPPLPDGTAWADPRYDESLLLSLGALEGDRVEGTLEYSVAWTRERAPARDVPLRITLLAGDASRDLNLTVESRGRVRFAGANPGGELALRVTPIDPVLLVGTKPAHLRVEVARESVLWSLLSLAFLGFAAAVLCFSATLCVRALSTSATAALTGLLLLATLTMLPGLAPAGRMVQDRRQAVEGVKSEGVLFQSLEALGSGLPELLPTVTFDEWLAGRVVPSTAWGDGLIRLALGLALLPAGALVFRLRQIAK